MSERLEEIEKYFTEMHESHFESEIYLGSDDVYWLIEQAERVQELEEDYEYLSHHYGLETEQNKRYREAEEKIKTIIDKEYDDVLYTKKEALRDISEALESELE